MEILLILQVFHYCVEDLFWWSRILPMVMIPRRLVYRRRHAYTEKSAFNGDFTFNLEQRTQKTNAYNIGIVKNHKPRSRQSRAV
jgi:hypothetical protein